MKKRGEFTKKFENAAKGTLVKAMKEEVSPDSPLSISAEVTEAERMQAREWALRHTSDRSEKPARKKPAQWEL